MAVEYARRLFTVEEYERMGAAGILGEDDRVELIDGEIVEMTPIGPGHAACVNRLTRRLVGALGNRAVVTVQNPVRLPPRSEPQPDLVIARERADFYASGHPTSADVLLAIEVAESSVVFDRAVKGPLYARMGIAEYWLVDLGADVVVAHRRPTPTGYEDVRTSGRGDVLAPQSLPDLLIAVTEVLGAD